MTSVRVLLRTASFPSNYITVRTTCTKQLIRTASRSTTVSSLGCNYDAIWYVQDGFRPQNTLIHVGNDVSRSSMGSLYDQFLDEIFESRNLYVILQFKKLKQSRYTPWRRLGGEEV
jgi:hypothetical protein